MRIASSCDFGSIQAGSSQREGSLPPPYTWTTSEKDHIPDVMKTIEDTIRGLDHELRQLSLDIHGERSHTAPLAGQTPKVTETCDLHFRSPRAQFRGEVSLQLEISPVDTPGQ